MVRNFVKLTVTDYTDYLGFDVYHLKLPQVRANTAKVYLRAKIKAVDRGKKNLVKVCKGVQDQVLKDCLKPNSSVVI